jgi:hypothetical protein
MKRCLRSLGYSRDHYKARNERSDFRINWPVSESCVFWDLMTSGKTGANRRMP